MLAGKVLQSTAHTAYNNGGNDTLGLADHVKNTLHKVGGMNKDYLQGFEAKMAAFGINSAEIGPLLKALGTTGALGAGIGALPGAAAGAIRADPGHRLEGAGKGALGGAIGGATLGAAGAAGGSALGNHLASQHNAALRASGKIISPAADKLSRIFSSIIMSTAGVPVGGLLGGVSGGALSGKAQGSKLEQLKEFIRHKLTKSGQAVDNTPTKAESITQIGAGRDAGLKRLIAKQPSPKPKVYNPAGEQSKTMRKTWKAEGI